VPDKEAAIVLSSIRMKAHLLSLCAAPIKLLLFVGTEGHKPFLGSSKQTIVYVTSPISIQQIKCHSQYQS